MSTLDEILDRVRGAAAAKRPLNIIGGDSKRHIGRAAQGDPLDTSGLSGVVDYQPSELVVTVRAGTTVSELQQTLAEKNQVLAGEPPEFGGKATVGGTLASGLSGPSRPWLGSIRDHVLGVRIINGRAEHLRFGGQVMKNVAGYDVSRLQAGAMGTLGVLTEVSLKVVPLPEATITVRRSLSADDALRTMNEICRTPLPVTGACWLDGEMAIRLSGPAVVVDAAGRQLGGTIGSDAAGFWAGLRDMSLPFFSDTIDLWCVSLRSTRDHFRPDDDWLLDWRGARRWLAARCDRDQLNEDVGSAGNELWHVRGARTDADVFPLRAEAYRRTLQRLKAALDPAGIFNPGRLYSWL